MPKEPNKPIPFIRELCKDHTEDEILEAELNFREYLLVVKEICGCMEYKQNIPPPVDEDAACEIV